MRSCKAAVLAALLGSAQAWDASCLTACSPTVSLGGFGIRVVEPYPAGPTGSNGNTVCPQKSFSASSPAYAVSLTAANSKQCPGGCTKINTEAECENAAKWLRLGMDGAEGACPTADDLVGAGGAWDATAIDSQTAGENAGVWQQRLGGCSWTPMGQRKLWWNNGEAGNVDNIAVQADYLQNWLICSCPALEALPKYLPVVAGNQCPDAEREAAMGRSPTCGFLTAESNCWEATSAGQLNFVDKSLEMCINCDDANAVPANDLSINSASNGPYRPAGCHYRYKPERQDDHLWFNPHYNRTSPSYAQQPGEGRTPDYLICGCGDIAPYTLPTQSCQPVGSAQAMRSKACGVGQSCSSHSEGYLCMCDFPFSNPDTAINKPAECREEIPIKYVSWVTGTECPYDSHSRCLPPPTRERCEHAATMLGLADADTKASIAHGAADRNAPMGCHYLAGDRSALRWNPNGTGDVPATPADSLICECEHYPMYVPKLAGGGCGSMEGSCHAVKSRFECGLAADSMQIPVPAALGQAQWNTTLCTIMPAAGAGSPYVPCGTPGAADCDAAGATVRHCRFSDATGWVVVAAPSGDVTALDGCTYHAAPAAVGDSPLWFYNESMGDVNALNSVSDFRLCDCCDDSLHEIIAPRLGYELVGDGDCAKGTAPGGTCAGQQEDLCVVRGSDALIRADRLKCPEMTSEAMCKADDVICKWDDASQTCDWQSNSFVGEGEVFATFSDCLEHCLLLCHCTGVSFFTPLGVDRGARGGCDFFTNLIVDATGEAVRAGKGQGEWKCYRNIPESPPTPAPTYDCPECNRIPTAGECRQQFGCAWSGQYCCCDPFISECTHSWHTTTNTQETCEAASDEGRQCKWLQGANFGICELPLEQCVDVYADFVLAVPLAGAGDIDELCTAIIDQLKQSALGVQAGCGNSCNGTAAGSNTVVSIAIDLTGNKTCGQSTRMSAKISNFLDTLPTLAGNTLVSHDVRSKCWDDCARNPLCPKGPTAAPTPVGGPSPTGSPRTTLPPLVVQTGAPQNVSQDIPTAGPTQSPAAGSPPTTPPTLNPTASPDLCPVRLEIDSPTDFTCECERFDCRSTPSLFNNSAYEICGGCDRRLDNAHHFVCPVCAPGDTQMNVTCPNHYEACDIVVMLYTGGCAQTVNGGWSQTLPAEGFTSHSCSPVLCGNSTCADEPNPQHRTLSYFKQILSGETEELPATTTDPTMYFTILVQQSRVCGSIQDEDECNNSPGLCGFADGACQSFVCGVPAPPKTNAPTIFKPQGPGGPPREQNTFGPSPSNEACCMLGSPGGECVIAEGYTP